MIPAEVVRIFAGGTSGLELVGRHGRFRVTRERL